MILHGDHHRVDLRPRDQLAIVHLSFGSEVPAVQRLGSARPGEVVVLRLLCFEVAVESQFCRVVEDYLPLVELRAVVMQFVITHHKRPRVVAIASGVAAIVLSLIFIVAVDGMFDLGLVRFFREMNGEVKKLTWLSGKELFSHTLAVLVFVLAMAAIIYLLDLAFSSGFSAVSNINIG